MKIPKQWVCIAAICLASEAMGAPPNDEPVTGAGPTTQQRAEQERLDRFIDETLHSSNLRLRMLFGSMPNIAVDDRRVRTRAPVDELASASGDTRGT